MFSIFLQNVEHIVASRNCHQNLNISTLNSGVDSGDAWGAMPEHRVQKREMENPHYYKHPWIRKAIIGSVTISLHLQKIY